MMNRRQLFAGLFAAPLAAATSCAEPEPKPSPRKVTRIITVPGVLSQEAAARIARNVQEAIDNERVIILEDGATYHEFYGEPVPIKFADGGIVNPEECRVLGLNHVCTHPVKVIERPSTLAGNLVVNVTCDSSDFDRDISRITARLKEVIALKKQLA